MQPTRTHPFDVVGWDGCLYPYTFNVEDYMPITGKVHQPPPVHQVFEGHNFVICNFLPRKVDYHPLVDPGALLPLQRRLATRSCSTSAATTRPARARASASARSRCTPVATPTVPSRVPSRPRLGAEYFDESAVMVDTFVPLRARRGRLAAEDPAYASSWSKGRWIG